MSRTSQTKKKVEVEVSISSRRNALTREEARTIEKIKKPGEDGGAGSMRTQTFNFHTGQSFQYVL